MAPKKTEPEVSTVSVQLQAPDMRRVQFKVGGQMLVTHPMTSKIKEGLGGFKPPGKARRGPRDVKAEFEAGFYRTEDGRPGILARFFQRAMVSSCSFLGKQISKTLVRGAVRVEGGILPLEFDGEPVCREDVVRVGGKAGPGSGQPDMRYRPGFANWSVELTILYDATLISVDQIAVLLQRAGQNVGVGEGRREKTDMGWGDFEVLSVEAKKATA